jgi:hypothetical protein
MHMANHSCSPNGRAIPYEPEGWNNHDDFVLLVLVAIHHIKRGETITFQNKCSIWQPLAMLLPLSPPGFRLIQCGCNKPCCNSLGRLDWIGTSTNTSPKVSEKWFCGGKSELDTAYSVDYSNALSESVSHPIAKSKALTRDEPSRKTACHN